MGKQNTCMHCKYMTLTATVLATQRMIYTVIGLVTPNTFTFDRHTLHKFTIATFTVHNNCRKLSSYIHPEKTFQWRGDGCGSIDNRGGRRDWKCLYMYAEDPCLSRSRDSIKVALKCIIQFRYMSQRLSI